MSRFLVIVTLASLLVSGMAAGTGGHWDAPVPHPSPLSTSNPELRSPPAATGVGSDHFAGAGRRPVALPSANQTADWLNITNFTSNQSSSPSAIALLDSSIAWDAADGYFLMYSPNTPSDYATHTWVLSHGIWSEVRTPDQPPPVANPMLAYDATDHYVVLVGGYPSGPFVDYTWTYSAGSWTNRTSESTSSPSPRLGSGFAYDPSLSSMLLFGGDGSCQQFPDGTWGAFGCFYHDTWTYRAGRWSNITANLTTAPGTRAGPAMNYDPSCGCVLLFGGAISGSGALDHDWWSFASGKWTNLTNESHPHPSGRAGAQSTFVPGWNESVLFGGTLDIFNVQQPAYQNDTWAYRNGSWVNLTTSLAGSGPVPGWLLVAFAYDPADNFTLLVTARPGSNYPVYDQAEFSLGPSALLFYHASTMALDLGQSFAVNATAIPPTSNLTFTTPPGCTSPSAGNLSCTPLVAGPFALNLSTVGVGGQTVVVRIVVEVHPDPGIASFVLAPPAVTLGNTTRLVVLPVNGTPPFTFGYSGLPAGCGSVNLSSWNCTPSALGTFPIQAWARDVTGDAAYANATLVVNPRTSAGPLLISPSLIDLGSAVQLQTDVSGGTPPLSFRWAGLPSGCAPESSATLACVPAASGTFPITVTATDADGWAAVSTATLTVLPALTLEEFTIAPSPSEVGVGTSLRATVTGGDGTYSYRVTGFPNPCLWGAATNVTCYPSQTGNFTVTLTVTDTLGTSVNASLTLSVAPALTLSSFTFPVPARADLGQTSAATLSFSGGVAPVTVTFGPLTGGAARCLPAGSTDACTWEGAGYVTLLATLRDAAGQSVQSSASIEVHPLPSVASLTISPSAADQGTSATLTANVTGGFPPYAIVWSGLPPGCGPASGPTFRCAPSAPGTYTIVATVTDALNGTADASVAWTVLPTFLGVPVLDLAIAGGVAAAVAIAAVWVLRRRRLAGKPATGGPQEDSASGGPEPGAE